MLSWPPRSLASSINWAQTSAGSVRQKRGDFLVLHMARQPSVVSSTAAPDGDRREDVRFYLARDPYGTRDDRLHRLKIREPCCVLGKHAIANEFVDVRVVDGDLAHWPLSMR